MKLATAFALAAALGLSAAPAAAFTDQQVAKGETLWRDPVRGKCGQCHTLDGEKDGIRTPLAGPKALPKKQYWEMAQGYFYWNTAADVADFIATDMPRGRPGTLTRDEALSLTAYILSKNGVRADGSEMTQPAAERLVLDDVLPQRATPYKLYGAIGGGAIVVVIAAWALLRRRRPA
jgi:mono/diheme cytochrome c family protein